MKVHVNGIDLAYSDEGQGHPIVFLHAFPLNRTMWAPQVEGLKDHYRIITIDLRGHGESDAPMWRYTFEQFADDIKGLLDHLSISHATCVGLSMGGYIFFALYKKYPHLIHSAVLADTRAEADTEKVKAARYSMAQIAYTRGATAIADLMLPKLLAPGSLETRKDIVDQLRQMISANQVSGIVGDLMAMEERPDSSPLLKEFRFPTLILVGEHDCASPPEEVKRMAQHIPGSHVALIPQAGHLSNLENPEAFNLALTQFLEDLPAVEEAMEAEQRRSVQMKEGIDGGELLFLKNPLDGIKKCLEIKGFDNDISRTNFFAIPRTSISASPPDMATTSTRNLMREKNGKASQPRVTEKEERGIGMFPFISGNLPKIEDLYHSPF